MPKPSPTVNEAYAECLAIAKGHYENFPVASLLVPRKLRGPIAAIYAFARRADDFADEGDLKPEERLSGLQGMHTALDHLEAGNTSDDAVFIALKDSIPRFNLPVELFRNLLSAFEQDVTKHRYAHFGEVMDYCRRSANPVGRLLLHLNNEATEKNIAYSDGVCSALQLINFYQDLAQDYHEQGRIYIPEDEITEYGVTEAHFRDGISDTAMRSLMNKQYHRTDKILRAGAPLGKHLRGRFGLEIRMTIMGGARVLYRLQQQQTDLFSRPRLTRRDWLAMIRGALLPR